MTDPDLVRFVDAQASLYDGVVEQLTEGHKRTHWMWFIFSQIAGLSHSAIAQHYAMRDLDQAKRYLADPILGSRLRHALARTSATIRKCSEWNSGRSSLGEHRVGDLATT